MSFFSTWISFSSPQKKSKWCWVKNSKSAETFSWLCQGRNFLFELKLILFELNFFNSFNHSESQISLFQKKVNKNNSFLSKVEKPIFRTFKETWRLLSFQLLIFQQNPFDVELNKFLCKPFTKFARKVLQFNQVNKKKKKILLIFGFNQSFFFHLWGGFLASWSF